MFGFSFNTGSLVMTAPLIREFKLAGPEGDGFHPYLNAEGAFLGNGTPLLEMEPAGRWRPRAQPDLEKILSAGYGDAIPLRRQMDNLAAVASALNKGDRCLAAITLVHAAFPALPDEYAADRMVKADTLAKNGDGYVIEPRVLSGPGGGQWTTGGATATAFGTMGRAALGLLTEFGAAIVAPVALLGGLLIPTNDSLMAEGTLPAHPDISYRYDEGLLTLTQSDGQGSTRLLFSGMPGMNDGLYRDQNGTVIGRQVGNNFMLSYAALASMRGDDTRSRSDAGATSIAATATSEPKLCPDPGPDIPGNKSERAIAYQSQITGLPPGLAVQLNGVMFDGCRTTDGTMLEAKGPGIAQHLTDDGEWKPYITLTGKAALDNQIMRQSEAAGDRIVEWHVAEPRLAAYITQFAKSKGYSNIIVINTPARMP